MERRKTPPIPEREMYKISDIDDFIKSEKRRDELKRLNEVKEQKRVWITIVLLCGAMNLILATFAIIGYVNNG